MAQTEFRQITECFEQAKYQDGLKATQSMLQVLPRNSNLHLNSAVFRSQMEQDGQALRDIQTSLKLNPRNYIAYFNKFSLHYKNSDDQQALDSLCCSLSCLYLMKAKTQKSIVYADKAIKLCYNNIQAHVLKGLLLMEKQKYLESYYEFEQAVGVMPNQKVIQDLRSCAFQKAYPGQIELKQYYMQAQNQKPEKHLKCSYLRLKPIQEEIDEKLKEFNRLYREVSGFIDAITRKVISTCSTRKSAPQSYINKLDGSTVSVEDPGQATPLMSQAGPNPGQVYLRESRLASESRLSGGFSQFKSVINYEEQKQSKLQKQQNFQQFQSIIESHSQPSNIFQQPKQHQQEAVYQQMQADYNLIYPLDDNMKLKIELSRLQFIDINQEQTQKWKDVYCIINYAGNKVTTSTKYCEDKECIWNQQFRSLDIPVEPSDMKIKVYNKKYNSFRDEFLGDIEVLITTAERLRLPLYNKRGELVGNLIMKLWLEEKTPEPVSNETQ